LPSVVDDRAVADPEAEVDPAVVDPEAEAGLAAPRREAAALGVVADVAAPAERLI